jgi:hypothetical protein
MQFLTASMEEMPPVQEEPKKEARVRSRPFLSELVNRSMVHLAAVPFEMATDQTMIINNRSVSQARNDETSWVIRLFEGFSYDEDGGDVMFQDCDGGESRGDAENCHWGIEGEER